MKKPLNGCISLRALVSVVGAITLVAGGLMVTANAHIGASHSAVPTDGPDLLSATATTDDTARFCFDEEVTTVEDAENFWVFGYNAVYEWDSETAELTQGDRNCVDVTFGIDTDADIRENTVVLAGTAAVSDRDGDENPENSVALEGTLLETGPGRTDVPNLVSFDPISDTIRFTFDQNLDCSQLTDDGSTTDDADAENFGYYDEDGNIHYGDDVEDCNEREIDVAFTSDVTDPAGDDDPEEAERVFHAGEDNDDVTRDSVEPDSIDPSGQVCRPDSDLTDGLCTGFESLGSGVDDAPDLVSVERTDESEWTYTFDEDVDEDAVTASAFVIMEEESFEYTADSCSEDDGRDVECSFTSSDIEDALDFEFPLASVEHCAVESTDDPGVCGTYGSAPAATSGIAEGVTDAPDLETISLDSAGETATFCFDENLDDDEADTDGALFYLLDADGDHAADAADADVDDVQDRCAVIDFDEDDLTEAVGGGVEDFAVEDFLENQSRAAAAGPAVTGSTTTTTTTTTTSGASDPPTTTTTNGHSFTPPPPPPRRNRVASVVTIRYERNANAFTGSVGSRKRNCQRGRLVTLKKHRPGPNSSVGNDTTNRAGNWKIRKRVRRGRFYVVVAKKRYTNRRGTTIVCLRDKSVTIKV